jgi:hypothetical protein
MAADTPSRTFPYRDGDVTVLGPEIFASNDESTICWRGETYVRQSDQPASTVKVEIGVGPTNVDSEVLGSAIGRQLRRARRNPPSGSA